MFDKKDTRNCIFFVVFVKMLCYNMAYDLTKGDKYGRQCFTQTKSDVSS